MPSSALFYLSTVMCSQFKSFCILSDRFYPYMSKDLVPRNDAFRQ